MIDQREDLRKKIMDKEITGDEVLDWKCNTMKHFRRPSLPRKTWCRKGVEKISLSAQRYFEWKAGFELPYNLWYHGPAMGFSSHDRRIGEKRDEIVSAYARFSGWLKAAAELPGLVSFIRRTTSPQGMGSPRTKVNLWKFADRHPCPHRAARFLCKLRHRANQILSGYGLRVSWNALSETLDRGPRRVRKAAVHAAALTVEQFARKRRFLCKGIEPGIELYELWQKSDGHRVSGREFLVRIRGWKEARLAPDGVCQWAIEKVKERKYPDLATALVAAPSVLRQDFTDGVGIYIDPATETSIHGIKVIVGWWGSGGRRMWLVMTDDKSRSYHVPDCFADTPREAVRVAVKEWKKQGRLEKENKKIMQKLLPPDRSVLVWRKDSYQAGNCKPGTAAFAERHGFGHRSFVPAEWLFPHLGNPAVCRTLVAVAMGI